MSCEYRAGGIQNDHCLVHPESLKLDKSFLILPVCLCLWRRYDEGDIFIKH